MNPNDIDDAAVSRAANELFHRGRHASLEDIKAAIQAAAERRVGEKDRRKVLDESHPNERGYPGTGRRSVDQIHWRTLPQAKAPEPEIAMYVSEGMKREGARMFRKYRTMPLPDDLDLNRADDIASIIYEAMVSKRREEEGPTPHHPNGRVHWREGERKPGGILRIHRRKTDK